jgi:hypothetical protein
LFFGGVCKFMGIVTSRLHFIQLVFQYEIGTDTNQHQDEGKDCHPYGRQRGNPSSPIRGGFLLLLCFAFVKLSFYIADEPIPPWPTRVLSAIAGVLAFVCGYHGFDLVFDLRIRLASALNSPSPIPIGHEGACAGIEGAGFLLPQRGTHPPSIS